jgi:hypothetical protein
MNDAPAIQYDMPATLYKWPSLEGRFMSTGDTIGITASLRVRLGGAFGSFWRSRSVSGRSMRYSRIGSLDCGKLF